MTKPKHSQETPQEEGPAAQPVEPGLAAEGTIPAVDQSAELAAAQQELSAVRKELEDARAKTKEYSEGWQRERADFNNYKRRIERDQQTLSQTITGEVIKKYLLVLDDMDRAIRMRPADGDLSAWAGGIELIYRKLQNILDQEGVTRIPAETEDFNPARHEAITFEDSPAHASGAIIGVVQDGYTLGDRVLRPARVRVAR